MLADLVALFSVETGVCAVLELVGRCMGAVCRVSSIAGSWLAILCLEEFGCSAALASLAGDRSSGSLWFSQFETDSPSLLQFTNLAYDILLSFVTVSPGYLFFFDFLQLKMHECIN